MPTTPSTRSPATTALVFVGSLVFMGGLAWPGILLADASVGTASVVAAAMGAASGLTNVVVVRHLPLVERATSVGVTASIFGGLGAVGLLAGVVILMVRT